MNKLLRGVIMIISLIAFLSIPGISLGAERYEFRESFSKIWRTGSYARPRPWKEEEKAFVLAKLRLVERYAPGLIERTTAYRPILLYRVPVILQETMRAQSIDSHNGIFVADSFFEQGQFDYALVTLIHELSHLVDSSYRIQTGSRWRELVQPRIEMVQKALKVKGTPIGSTSLGAIEKQNTGLHTKAGLPSLYAATNLSEALAEFVTFDALRMSPAPEGIGTIVQEHFLSMPYRQEDALRHFHRGAEFHTLGKPGEAINAYTMALNADTAFRHVHLFRAYAYEAAGDLFRAAMDYLEALSVFKIEPFEGLIIVQIRSLVWQIDGTEQMAARVKETIRNDPDYLPYRFLMAELLKVKKDYKGAEKIYTEVIRLNPGVMEAYRARADARKLGNRIQEAIADFDVLINRGQDAYFERGECKALIEDFAGAIEDFTAAMASLPAPSPEMLFSRGKAYVQAGQYRKGLDDLRMARTFPGGWFEKTAQWITKAEGELGGNGSTKP